MNAMSIKPHVRRGSIWEYAAIAVPGLRHFGSSNDDVDTVMALVELRYVPQLLLCIIHGVECSNSILEFMETHSAALGSIKRNLDLSVSQGLLPIYEDGSYMRVSSSEIAI